MASDIIKMTGQEKLREIMFHRQWQIEEPRKLSRWRVEVVQQSTATVQRQPELDGKRYCRIVIAMFIAAFFYKYSHTSSEEQAAGKYMNAEQTQEIITGGEISYEIF